MRQAQHHQMRPRVLLACLGMLAASLGASGRAAGHSPENPADLSRADRTEPAFRGGMVTPPLAKPQFTLADTSGTTYDLWSKTQGYITLLFFGYTSCPDECPLQMANIAAALHKISADVAEQIKVVFVTTDPAHDSATVLRSWLDNFDERFIGLTGTEAAIVAAERATGTPPATRVTLANGSYEISHAAFVFAYSKDNLAHLIYPAGMTDEDWEHDLPNLVNEGWPSR